MKKTSLVVLFVLVMAMAIMPMVAADTGVMDPNGNPSSYGDGSSCIDPQGGPCANSASGESDASWTIDPNG